MQIYQLREAKARFSAIVDRIESAGEPVTITKHGRVAAVILSPAEYERLSCVPSLTELLFAFPGEPEDIPERSGKPHRPIEF